MEVIFVHTYSSIVNYDRRGFIVQATGAEINLVWSTKKFGQNFVQQNDGLMCRAASVT